MKIQEQNKVTQSYDLILNEITCPICGKTKLLPYGTDMKEYVYKLTIKNKLHYYCSYHCFREAQKKEEERRAAQKEKTKIKMGEVIRKMTAARWAKIRSEAK